MQNKNYFLVTQTPLRISFLGGGTDMKKFNEKHPGAVLSVAINKFVYVIIKKHNVLFKENIRLNYSVTEHVKNTSQIKNNIIKACLKKYPIIFPFYVSIVSDVPSNTGLGSSSSITVGVLKALHEIRGEKVSPQKLAEEACDIEINLLKNTPGKQDQYAAAIGGLNFFIFKKKKVIVHKIKNLKKIDEFLSKSILIWTGQYRKASKILIKQNKDTTKNLLFLKKMYELSVKGFELAKKKNFNTQKFCDLINYSWNLKKKLNNTISNKSIDRIYKNLSKKLSIRSGKILGAGGGGFLFLTLNSNKKFKDNLGFLKCKSSSHGAKVIMKEIY